MPKGAVPYVHAIPLQEVIAYVTKKSQASSYVKDAYAMWLARSRNGDECADEIRP